MADRQTPAAVEEAVLRKRKQLLEQGLDHGPQSIVWTLERDEMTAPSRSTVWRILTRHGLIVAQPQKRPKSATKRFCFSRVSVFLTSDRNSNSTLGMSIFTGQTSPQAPHRLDANGSDGSWVTPRNCGVMMAPIGPE